ncbi:unnamed protein product [Clonostachys rosea]|uniref:Uncharacterized protein n=1 Tax=Bionectria ochroleuca TaxID=29856 RepID=A0ABY6UKI4_BIOOC|nr:unnamed protein product [Clonostachys rosea]
MLGLDAEAIPAWKRELLLHYSDHIAAEMLVIDGLHNGWRHLVLPICFDDALVMDAVLTVSAFHHPMGFSLSHDQQFQPDILYARTITGLQARSKIAEYDRQSQHCIILTIMLLLTGIMVSGYPDFPILFHMLQSALDAIGGEKGLGSGEVAEFITRQINKLRVYAAPLLSEDYGIAALSSSERSEKMFGCLRYCLEQRPEHSESILKIPDIVQQACDIYLGHVIPCGEHALDPTTPIGKLESINRLSRFKQTLEIFPHDSPGEQVLIWATFMAASDCLLEEHKVFFEDFFRRHYMRSKFKNLEFGLDALRKIWARPLTERWTALLPQSKLFLM